MKNAFALIMVAMVTAFTVSNDRIEWRPDRPLNWSDFQAKAPTGTAFAALTRSELEVNSVGYEDSLLILEVTCWFDPSSSWVKSGTENPRLLAHEQGHFDITELHARKLRRELSALPPVRSDQMQAVLDSVYKAVRKENLEMDQRYDRETDRSRNEVAQEEWSNTIRKEIRQLGRYAPTRVTMSVN